MGQTPREESRSLLIPAHTTPFPFTEEENHNNTLTTHFTAAVHLASRYALKGVRELKQVQHASSGVRDIEDISGVKHDAKLCRVLGWMQKVVQKTINMTPSSDGPPTAD